MNYIGRMTRFLLIPLILVLTLLPSYSFIEGKIENGIPIDYTKLNQTETEAKAESYYSKAILSAELSDDMTNALNLYRMLANAYPDNVIYSLKLGKLYDAIGKDRYAKGFYYRAMNIDKTNSEPYRYLGDFFYKREQYRKALKFYLRAQERGNIQVGEKINEIYSRFGDSKRI